MFEIRATADTGLGWFATQDIPPDTVILDEDVMFRLPRSSTSADIKIALSKLTSVDKDTFYSLSGDNDLEKLWLNCVPLIHAADILGVGERTEIGIYKQCSRLNHSCRPNAVRASENDIMSVVSQKAIKTGQQITISYLTDNFQTAKARLREIRSKHPVLTPCWDLGCRCEVCTVPSEELTASDKRRKALASLRAQFLSKQGDGDNFRVLMTMIKVMEDEGLFISLMGMPASMKMVTHFSLMKGINPAAATLPELHQVCFTVGASVRLHALKAKPELNGRDGTVVATFDAKTGRVAVVLDSAGEKKGTPLAVKPANLLLVRGR